jgi:TonB family protein
MDSYANYLIEANFSLCVFALAYAVLFRKETDFRSNRIILAAGIICSLLFPLITVEGQQVLMLGDFVPVLLLPEYTVYGDAAGARESAGNPFTLLWSMLPYVYAAGVIVFMAAFVHQVVRVVVLIRRSRPQRSGKLFVAETDENIPSFSFFNYIILGQSPGLSDEDKERILLHERVHATQMHSLDILILNIISVFFWFNPVIRFYKKTFIQLHEFEADARAVKNDEVNDYCNLLARVALLSADIGIANHFSNSLTLKRIHMMRKIKFRIHRWKLYAMTAIVPAVFFLVACHDQVMQEVTDIASNSTMALQVPQNVQERYDYLSKANPDKKYIMVQLNSSGTEKIAELEKKYGLPSSVEVFKPGKEKSTTASGNVRVMTEITVLGYSENAVSAKSPVSDDEAYVILEYNDQSRSLSDAVQSKDGIFTIVDETAIFPGGMPKFYEFIAQELRYPAEARKKGIEGKIFIEFVIEKDGTLSNLAILKNVDETLDAEAMRVMALSPKWTPGRQRGEIVRQKMVLPIAFSLAKQGSLKINPALENMLFPFGPDYKKDKC